VRETLWVRKIGRKRKCTHEHKSVPFYMDGITRGAVHLGP
jgi:hypothetical protein